MNIRKQLNCLYLYSFASLLRITNAVWVVLLAARGFSLWQIGLAEGIFHVTSLLCEIPSGMAADLLGRRRTLALSGLLGAFSSVAMVAGGSYGWVCLSMAFSALSYNMISGTQEAITYDSLVQAGRSGEYLQVDANVSILQSLSGAISAAASLLAGVLSYVGFYLLDALIALTRSVAAFALQEPAVTERQRARQQAPFAALPARFKEHASLSIRFLADNPSVTKKILADSMISLPCYLTTMFLQQRLSELGLSTMLLGLPLIAVECCRMAATAVGRRLHPRSMLGLYAACALVGGAGTLAAGGAPIFWSVAGAMLAAGSCEVWFLHIQKNLNDAYPSDQRATLVSVNSMVYSLLMIAVSPLVGWVGDLAGSAGAGLCLLGGLLALTALPAALLLARRAG